MRLRCPHCQKPITVRLLKPDTAIGIQGGGESPETAAKGKDGPVPAPKTWPVREFTENGFRNRVFGGDRRKS